MTTTTTRSVNVRQLPRWAKPLLFLLLVAAPVAAIVFASSLH
jgi:hypothetical protein